MISAPAETPTDDDALAAVRRPSRRPPSAGLVRRTLTAAAAADVPGVLHPLARQRRFVRRLARAIGASGGATLWVPSFEPAADIGAAFLNGVARAAAGDDARLTLHLTVGPAQDVLAAPVPPPADRGAGRPRAVRFARERPGSVVAWAFDASDDGSARPRYALRLTLGRPALGRTRRRAARLLLRQADRLLAPRRLALATLVATLPAHQRRTLTHVLRGLSEKEIARAQNRSQHTVHAHVKAIYRRFGASSRLELTALLLG